MNNTKNKILSTSLELFNTYGLAKITLRAIAIKMSISQGNLNYHFKKREDIIEALYFQLVSNIDKSLSNTEDTENILELLFNISKTIMNNFYEYRFFLLDFVQIIRENKKIKLHYSNLTEQRKRQFALFFKELIGTGLMREEILPNEYQNLYKRFQILGDFWISSAEIKKQTLSKESITSYCELINQAIYPYLTPKGKKEYIKLTITL